jgi:leucyl/phenylalanyl-tRNA---protein transferase
LSPLDLPWIGVNDPLPPTSHAWPPESEAPGLLAAGHDLSLARLEEAYRHGVFPWFSDGQPVLWWSTNPRMVLPVKAFKLSRSLKKTLRRFARSASCEVRIDSAFDQVITACASAPRDGQDGTWILPVMQQAYSAWHRAGRVHSFETWIDGQLVGGLYAVSIGRMVFGRCSRIKPMLPKLPWQGWSLFAGRMTLRSSTASKTHAT